MKVEIKVSKDFIRQLFGFAASRITGDNDYHINAFVADNIIKINDIIKSENADVVVDNENFKINL